MSLAALLMRPTHSYTNIAFLDISVSIVNNTLVTDLFRKPTDRCQYLLPSSCSPAATFKSIPYSLALRLVRIVSDPVQLEVRLEELKQLLLSRDYRPKVVDAAIAKATAIPRERALQKVEKKESDRVVFALSFACS